MMTAFQAPHPDLVAARWKGGAQTPKDIVLHSTVTPCDFGWARKVAHFFATEDNKTSAHYIVDPGEVIQCVGDHTVAYHCGFNQDSIAVEMCEFPSLLNLARWLSPKHIMMRKRAQRLVARLCLAYDIPPYYRGVKARLDGKHGVTTHNVMSKAFKQSTHWDPGAWPRRLFMRGVRKRIEVLKARHG
jgi:N-acetylmuramoyl-L-alanine amidase CwlA